jgi:quinol monooxygenase YgiN
MAIRVVAREKLQSGKKEELLPLYREMVEATRKEKGCISYNLHELVEDADVLAMIETWESREALDAHMKSEHFQRLIPQIGKYTAQPPRIEIYEEIL